MNQNDIPDELMHNVNRPSASPKPRQNPTPQSIRQPSVPRPSATSSAMQGAVSSAANPVVQRKPVSDGAKPPVQRQTVQRPATMQGETVQRRAVSGNTIHAGASSAAKQRNNAVSPRRHTEQGNLNDTRLINHVSSKRPDNGDDNVEASVNTVSSLVKAILYIVIVVAVAGLLSYYIIMFGNDMYAFVKNDEEVEVTIPEYATVEEIADVLGDAGVIKYPSLLVIYAKLKKIDKTYEFVAGDYTVNGMMNYDELFYAFVKHKSYETVRLTIPEGYTVDEIIKLMTENGIGTREGFIDVINNYEFDFDFVKALDAADLTGRTYRLEGYLYPDTYEFYKSSSEATVIYKLLSRFNVIFADDFYKLSSDLGYSVDQIITLASMIEKEARYSVDYEQISSVFHNRLNNPSVYPYLESDATIMYAIQVRDGERKTTLTSADMNYNTPYNSYMYPGLPPGPIANPGYEAITCALYPAKTGYYFFVSDNYGNTYFSKTLAQHNIAKEKVRQINSEG